MKEHVIFVQGSEAEALREAGKNASEAEAERKRKNVLDPNLLNHGKKGMFYSAVICLTEKLCRYNAQNIHMNICFSQVVKIIIYALEQFNCASPF